MLEEIKESDDIYEAFAIRFGMWNPDEEDKPFKKHPKLRHSVKGMVLGCGYGAGAGRFASMSNISEKEADKRVKKYRSKMKKVKTLWSKYNSEIEGSHEASQQIPTEFSVDLPSGRVINYGVLISKADSGRLHFIAGIPRHGKVRLWGGLVAENASQALARDIFSDMMLRVEEAGHKIIMHVHDEMVIESTVEFAEQDLADVIEIMSEPPTWIPDIPLSAEGSILTRYEK